MPMPESIEIESVYPADIQVKCTKCGYNLCSACYKVLTPHDDLFCEECSPAHGGSRVTSELQEKNWDKHHDCGG